MDRPGNPRDSSGHRTVPVQHAVSRCERCAAFRSVSCPIEDHLDIDAA
ncbi:hypothetical protein L083_0722 [Actinoplanes sp. N902-109]|nr:hypothetical protein L083_0722 [Actinoplanes sp. N902-109]